MSRQTPQDDSRSRPPKRRLVVGCGALGMRVARRWLAAGDQVWGTTRSRPAELASVGITPVVADIGGGTLPALPAVDTVFWAVGFDPSSGLSPRQLHVEGLEQLLAAVPNPDRVVLSSSTGVWGDGDGETVNELTPACPARPSAAALLEAEALLSRHPAGPGVSLRFAGLYGPERLPRLDALRAGTPLAADPDSWLNLIHLDDAALVVCLAADAPHAKSLYVVSDGMPLRRGDWYRQLAHLHGCPPPKFNPPAATARGATARGGSKRADVTRLFTELAPRLAYPNALEALEQLTASS
ncbi:MAG: SDR family NAD(P)-dependent oxidoreductase [Pirellulales bacterium]|jgi:nucleoside-diphosphate-sugar epimerase|nr:SDR family NAD(P)-dependent oxidoreductase [Pirellulales bacterium]